MPPASTLPPVTFLRFMPAGIMARPIMAAATTAAVITAAGAVTMVGTATVVPSIGARAITTAALIGAASTAAIAGATMAVITAAVSGDVSHSGAGVDVPRALTLDCLRRGAALTAPERQGGRREEAVSCLR